MAHKQQRLSRSRKHLKRQADATETESEVTTTRRVRTTTTPEDEPSITTTRAARTSTTAEDPTTEEATTTTRAARTTTAVSSTTLTSASIANSLPSPGSSANSANSVNSASSGAAAAPSSTSSSSGSGSNTAGTVAGVVVAVIGLVLLFVAILGYRRYKNNKAARGSSQTFLDKKDYSSTSNLHGTTAHTSETYSPPITEKISVGSPNYGAIAPDWNSPPNTGAHNSPLPNTNYHTPQPIATYGNAGNPNTPWSPPPTKLNRGDLDKYAPVSYPPPAAVPTTVESINTEIQSNVDSYQSPPTPVNSSVSMVPPSTLLATSSVAAAAGAKAAAQDPSAENENPFESQDPRAGRVFIVVNTFVPSQTDELKINTGDRIKVITPYDDGWAFAHNLSVGPPYSEGFLPMECLSTEPEASRAPAIAVSPADYVQSSSSRQNLPDSLKSGDQQKAKRKSSLMASKDASLFLALGEGLDNDGAKRQYQ